MSGIKPMAVTLLRRKLVARGSSVSKVADQIFAGRSHVSQVLNGRLPGTQTWRKLERVLTADELALFGRVPRGTNVDVEQPQEAAR